MYICMFACTYVCMYGVHWFMIIEWSDIFDWSFILYSCAIDFPVMYLHRRASGAINNPSCSECTISLKNMLISNSVFEFVSFKKK